MTTAHKSRSPALRAVGYAMSRAGLVMFSGIVMLGLFMGFMAVGPGLEGQVNPTIKNYRLMDARTEPNGGMSFIPVFEKVRDCAYLGVNWFAPNERGNLVRIQVAPLETDPTAPKTGPVGRREGNRQVIYPPKGAKTVMAIMTHDCWSLWSTRTTIGPFPIADGIPYNWDEVDAEGKPISHSASGAPNP